MKRQEISGILERAYEGISSIELAKSSCRKYVLTGGPCCGKTTLSEKLEREGFYVVPEVARIIIDDQLGSGGDALPWKNRRRFQDFVIAGQAILEQSLPEDELVILDRAMPDNLAYFINDRTTVTNEHYKLFNSFCPYDYVFIPDRLPMENDYARRESEKEADKLHRIITGTYEKLGNPISKVPVFNNIDDRVNYVTSIIEEKERESGKAAQYLASGHAGIYSDPGLIGSIRKRNNK